MPLARAHTQTLMLLHNIENSRAAKRENSRNVLAKHCQLSSTDLFLKS